MNFLVDAPPGVMLGQDKGTPDLMDRPPRPAHQPIITRPLAIWLGLGGLSTAIAALGTMVYAEGIGTSLETVRTLGFVTFSLEPSPPIPHPGHREKRAHPRTVA